MRAIGTLTWLTLAEAWRRWMVLAALALGAAFVLLYGLGVHFVEDQLRATTPRFLYANAHNFLLLAGLYVVHFLTIMLAIFASVDAVAGEITSHTIQTLVTKPVRRWQVLLGKWAGYAIMLTVYLFALGGSLMLVMQALTGYVAPHPLLGLSLIVLEALVLLSLALLGGTRLSTLSNGVVLFLLYGVSFIGSWVEQIGSILQVPQAETIGRWTGYVLPVEELWRRVAAELTPPDTGLSNFVSPFAAFAVPDPAIVWYTLAYAAVALGLALVAFSRRDL